MKRFLTRIFEIKKKKLLLQFSCMAFRNLSYFPFLFMGSGGEIGRHARLRGVCLTACGFKSRPEHHLSPSASYFRWGI